MQYELKRYKFNIYIKWGAIIYNIYYIIICIHLLYIVYDIHHRRRYNEYNIIYNTRIP